MRYFNGFSLIGEEIFFKEQLIKSDFAVAGFSYGAIKAFEYVYETSNRVDRLILLSPAFFQNHKRSFIRTQLRYYRANEEAYREQFLENVAYPSRIDLRAYLEKGTIDELEALLSYHWDRDKIKAVLGRGVTIEVYIGEEDKIVNADKSFEFFKELVPCYFIKGVGHLLQQ
jgi:pimeloyl-ACP methyl ester carboxylesterase